MAKKHVTIEAEADPFLEPVEPEIEPVKEVKPVKNDIYKDALATVLKMIQTGTHVENIMKYINTVLK